MMDKRRGETISLRLKLFIVFIVAISGGEYGGVKALRMKNPAVKAASDILIVGAPVKLTCNYFKFTSEKIRKITWYAGYDGMSSKILEYQVNGRATSHGVYSWIKVDEGTATDKDLIITLPEFRENKMVVKCEVDASSETSGRRRKITQAGEAELDVADANSHQLQLKKGRPSASLASLGSSRTATVGQELIVSCLSFGASQQPNLTLHINNEDITAVYGGRVDLENVTIGSYYSSSPGVALIGYVDSVYDGLFDRSNLLVECKAWYGDQIFKKKQMHLTKQLPRKSRLTGTVRTPVRNTHSGGPIGAFERHAEDVHSHLLEMMDPSRHVHPGIPYDFYSGYVVVEAENLDGSGYSYGSSAQKTIVLGQLPQNVRRKLENERGKYQYVDANKVIMKLNAVKVLNILGGMDYRVIGNSFGNFGTSPDKKKLIWTLEHKDFEKLRDLQNNDLGHRAHGDIY